MRNEPLWLNTRQDYQNLRETFPDDVWRRRWAELLDTTHAWLPERELAKAADGITDDTHRVVEHTDSDGSAIRCIQEAWQLDPNCKLFRLGFTVDEVQNALL